MNKQVVYTCITGGYDRLREPKYVSPSIDYICFTDNAKLTSNFWKIRQLPSDLKNLTDVKKQRLIKVLPHKYLSEYDVSLWVDSNIEIVGDLKDFFNKYDLSQKFLYTNKHPSRDCLYREQIAVLRLKKDTYESTNPQIERYREEGFPEHYGLAETNIILRAHKNQKCKTLMNLWGEEILNGSHRDQLSFNYAIWKTGTKDYVEYLDEKYYNLHLSDNNFFKLATHIKADSFERFKTIDTNPPPESEPIEEEEKTEEEYHEEEPLPIVEEEPKKALLADPICVVMFTHNRTHVATAVIKSLVRNIVYPNIKWIISDDRSNPGHVEDICDLMRQMKISPIVCRTDSKRWGLGASMNNGLREAFKHSDIVLRTEDDWYLEKKLYLEPMVELLKKNKEAAGIRLAMVGKGVATDPKITLAKGYKSLVGGTSSWVFNNQVMLVHKRTHDMLGWYKENVGADKEETEFKDRFNEKTDSGKKKLHLFCPNGIKWNTLDDPSLWFIHVGRSTLGHEVYREPQRYSWIYKVNDPKKAKEIKEKRKEEQRVLDNKAVDKILKVEKKDNEKKEEKIPKIFFKLQQKEIKLNPTVVIEKKKTEEENAIIEQPKKEIEKTIANKKEKEIVAEKKKLPIVTVIMTTHNRTRVACESIESLCNNLKYDGKLYWCISDDRSDPGHLETLIDQFAKHDIIPIIKRTNAKVNSLGAAMNNGLFEGFKYSNVVLTTEDDWILQKKLDITKHVLKLENSDAAAIRLACILNSHLISIDNKYYQVYGKLKDKKISVFNNQVALRHKRIYDKLGYYYPNISPDNCECSYRNKFNKFTKFGLENSYRVLFPKEIKAFTLDDPSLYFIHVGKSTIGHSYEVPKRYRYMYEENSEMNICMVIDNNYINQTLALIQNLKEIDNIPKIIYLLGWNVSDENRYLLQSQSNMFCTVKVIGVLDYYLNLCIKVGGYERDKNRYTVPPTGLLKFCIGDILRNVDKVLYLDGDILINSSLKTLYDANIENVYCAAVPDIGSVTMVGKALFRIMQKNPHYFNSGVMLLNLKKIRKDGMMSKLFKIKETLPDRSLMDQDALNIGFDKKILLLPCRFNYLRSIDTNLKNGTISLSDINRLYKTQYKTIFELQDPKNIVIFHFAGPTKPWKPELEIWKKRLNRCLMKI